VLPFITPMLLGGGVVGGVMDTSWTLFSGGKIAGGRCIANNVNSICQQNPQLVAGLTYNFSFDYSKGSGSKLRIATGAANGTNVVYTSGALANGIGTLSGSFVAQAGAPYFRIEGDTTQYWGGIDNVVLTTGGGPNLIFDPTFDVANPAASTPWVLNAGSIASGKYSVGGGAQLCQQNLFLVPGTTYNFSFDYTMSSGSALRISTGLTNGSNTLYTSGGLGASGTVSGSFVAVSGGPYFGIEAHNALFSGTIDNVVVTTGGGPNLVSDGTFTIPS
jgi:hypothetical protein